MRRMWLGREIFFDWPFSPCLSKSFNVVSCVYSGGGLTATTGPDNRNNYLTLD